MPELQEILDGLKDNTELETNLFNSLKDREIGKGIFNTTVEGAVDVRSNEKAQSLANKMFEDNIGEKVKEIHSKWENTLGELSGIKRNEGEKGFSEYAPRVFNELNAKDANANNNNFDTEKYNTELNKWKSENETLKAKNKDLQLDHLLSNSLSDIKLKDKLSEFELRGRDSVISELKNSAVLDNGNWVFKNSEGNILRGEDFTTPLTASQILDQRLEGLKPAKRQTGGGADPSGSGGEKNSISNFRFSADNKIDALKEYDSYLKSTGIDPGKDSEKWTNLRVKFVTNEAYKNLQK